MRLVSAAGKILGILRNGLDLGWCPVCERWTVFLRTGPWDRDDCKCVRCRSIPRLRAMAVVIGSELPGWRTLEIHESSPEGTFSNKLRVQAPGYSSSQFLPGVPRGAVVGGIRNEDLRALTFSDSSLDLFVTQDVLEHVPDPDSAFKEIARVLRPGGLHIFTVPVYAKPSRERARQLPDGSIELLDTPEYHGNPVDPNGSLVITEWGPDLLDRIRSTSGMETRRFDFHDPRRGLRGEFLSVFVSRKHA